MGDEFRTQVHVSSAAYEVQDLTVREIRIASLVAAGASNRRIANDLCISPHTVAAHLCNMLRRTGASNRTEMIARLYARGLLVQGTWPPLPAEAPHYGNEVPVAMTFDALHALREAGHPVDLLAVEQRSVLSQLSELEVQVLNSVKGRLDAAAADVEGQDLKLL
ncbi:response regulator transcription factor [Streptomyces coeruleoprunus]|uniref:Response regulator transcription factor n=1 Tax=Streptomyces coeruleoprunus TaxID=285563 RepID=A0ABV9XAF5_9ACTN